MMNDTEYYSHIDPRLLMKHTGAGFDHPDPDNSTAQAYAQDILSTQTRLPLNHSHSIDPHLLDLPRDDAELDLASRVSTVAAPVSSGLGQSTPRRDSQQHYRTLGDSGEVLLRSPTQSRKRKRSNHALSPTHPRDPTTNPAAWSGEPSSLDRGAVGVLTRDSSRRTSRTTRQGERPKTRLPSVAVTTQPERSLPTPDQNRTLLPDYQTATLDTGRWLTQTHNVGYSGQLLPRAVRVITTDQPVVLPAPRTSQTSNSGQGIYYCEVHGCEYHEKYGKPFTTPSALTKHMGSHGPKIHFCLVDGCTRQEGFVDVRGLQRHNDTHEGRRWTCPRCGTSSSRPDNGKRHMKSKACEKSVAALSQESESILSTAQSTQSTFYLSRPPETLNLPPWPVPVTPGTTVTSVGSMAQEETTSKGGEGYQSIDANVHWTQPMSKARSSRF